MVFNLKSSIVSPEPPPVAGSGFVTAKDSLTKDNKLPFKFGLLARDIDDIVFIVFERTLDLIPPPTRYVTVSVVFEGILP